MDCDAATGSECLPVAQAQSDCRKETGTLLRCAQLQNECVNATSRGGADVVKNAQLRPDMKVPSCFLKSLYRCHDVARSSHTLNRDHPCRPAGPVRD